MCAPCVPEFVWLCCKASGISGQRRLHATLCSFSHKALQVQRENKDELFIYVCVSVFRRELNGNNLTRITKSDFAGLKYIRVL